MSTYMDMPEYRKNEIRLRARRAFRARYAAMSLEERKALALRNNERAKLRDSKEKRSMQNRAYRDRVAEKAGDKVKRRADGSLKRRSSEAIARFYALSPEEQLKRRRKNMLMQARVRALRDGVPFKLAMKDVVWADRCPIFDHPLIHAGGDWRWNPSIDRKVPELGYTPENCWVISRLANTMKSCASKEELLKFSSFMLDMLKKDAGT